jgi:serine/threonine protein kinase
MPFSHLLQDLHTLHKRGYCHDDVKPQNIFIESPEHWLLGDLGNARNVEHGWHSTNLWRRRNQWSDCQLNDIRRALKSYMFFLRDACDDADAFDYVFLHAETEWARLYWTFVDQPKSQYQDTMSDQPKSSAVLSGKQERFSGTWMGDFTRRLIVDKELTCTQIWYKVWFTY